MAGPTSGVQFMGSTQVVNAYINMNIPRWSIVCGSDLVEAYEGTSMKDGASHLSQFLEQLTESESRAIYSLKVYDKLAKGDKIRPKTECLRSFKFTLFEVARPVSSGYQQILDRLDQIEARQTLLNDEDDDQEDDKVSGVGSFIDRLLENDQIKQALGAGIAKVIEIITKPLMSMGDTSPQMQPQAAAIGNPSGELSPEQIQKVQDALPVLAQADPNLGDHLFAIAQIAKNSPAKYQMLVGMLKNF